MINPRQAMVYVVKTGLFWLNIGCNNTLVILIFALFQIQLLLRISFRIQNMCRTSFCWKTTMDFCTASSANHLALI